MDAAKWIQRTASQIQKHRKLPPDESIRIAQGLYTKLVDAQRPKRLRKPPKNTAEFIPPTYVGKRYKALEEVRRRNVTPCSCSVSVVIPTKPKRIRKRYKSLSPEDIRQFNETARRMKLQRADDAHAAAMLQWEEQERKARLACTKQNEKGWA